MIKGLLLHPQTRQDIERFVQSPKHALLITGGSGSGKMTVAVDAASEILSVDPTTLQDYPYFMTIQTTPVGIDQIRSITTFLRLRTTGSRTIRRVIIIENANTMTTEAQNALLKSLEEPPADTLIILLADRAQSLLPTVTSRVTTVPIKTPSYDAIKEYFSEPESSLIVAHALSDGKVGLLQALLSEDNDHPLIQKITEAKKLLQMTTYKKLIEVNTLGANKDEARKLLSALKQIATAALKQTDDPKHAQRWHRVLLQSHRTEILLDESVNTKLALTDLMLNL